MDKTLFEKELTFDLELNKDIMETILESYKTTYVMNKMYNTPEYNNMMSNVNKNIEQEFISMEKLQNTLLNKITTQQKEIEIKSKSLNDIRNAYTTLSTKEKTSNNIANAAGPRYNDTKTSYTFLIVYVCIQVLSILVIFYLLYRSYTPNIKAQIKNDANKVTSKVSSNIIKPTNNVNPVKTKNLPSSINK